MSAMNVTDKHIEHLFAKRRWCVFIPMDSFVEGQGYRVAIVFEHEPGFHWTGTWPYEGKPEQKAPWFWGPSYEEAVRQAEEYNERLGVPARAAVEIVASSMRGGGRR